jgi:uncharacterized membrane-anchored protein YjiN (DUF445 family)
VKQGEVVIESFEKLVESLQVDLKSTEELKKLKSELMERPEWKNIGRNRMSSLSEDFNRLSEVILAQIEYLARGLKTQLIINTKIEDSLAKEMRSAR